MIYVAIFAILAVIAVASVDSAYAQVSPTFQPVTVSGFSGSTVSVNLDVRPPDFTIISVAGSDTTSFTLAGGTVNATSLSDPITLEFVLPTVTETTELTEMLRITYFNMGTTSSLVTATITVNPAAPNPPTIESLRPSLSPGQGVRITLDVSDIPPGYSFASAAPASNLGDDVMAFGYIRSNGDPAIVFNLAPDNTDTSITGDLIVTYNNGTSDLEFTVPVEITVTSPGSSIQYPHFPITGASGATVDYTLQVGNAPDGFALDSVGNRNSDFFRVNGSYAIISGTDLGIRFMLPTVTTAAVYEGQMSVTYTISGSSSTDLVDFVAFVNPATTDLPTIQDIAVNGTAGTSIPHNLQVSDVPSGYSFLSAAPDSALSTANVTASGTESSGTVTVTFGLPTVGDPTDITGNLDVRYSNGTDNLDVAVPVTLRVQPVPHPTFQNITVNGTSGATVTGNLGVVPSDFTIDLITLSGGPTTPFRQAGGTFSAISTGDPITLEFGLPLVTETTTYTQSFSIFYSLNGQTFAPARTATITVNPTLLTIQSITLTGTAGTSIPHNLQVSDVPPGYSFLSAAPDSGLSGVTASGAESGGTITVTFGLPTVSTTTTLTGNLDVRYSNGTDNLDVAVPVTLTVNPTVLPDPPSDASEEGIPIASGSPLGDAVDSDLLLDEDVRITQVLVRLGTDRDEQSGGIANYEAIIDPEHLFGAGGQYTLNLVDAMPISTETMEILPTHLNDDDGLLYIYDEPAQSGETVGRFTISASFDDGRDRTTDTIEVLVTVDLTDDTEESAIIRGAMRIPNLTFQDITVSGTSRGIVNHVLDVTGVPDVYSFLSVALDSDLNDVAVSDAESNGTVTITFGLPRVDETTTINGTLLVKYRDSFYSIDRDFDVPVAITVNPPVPPTVTDITATGTEDTTIIESIMVTNVPPGYAYTSVSADSALSDAGVSITGTESNGTIAVSIGLPSAQTITGNVVVSYGDGTSTLTSNSAVSLTVEPAPVVPVFQNITVTGTGGTTLNANLPVTPTDFTAVSVTGSNGSPFNQAGGTVTATRLSNPITLAFGLPTVNTTSTLTETLRVTYGANANVLSLVTATITINPAPAAPVFQNITVSGTAGTTVNANLPVAPSDLTVISVTGSNGSPFNQAGGTVTATNLGNPITLAFDLPTVSTTSTLTETLRVTYGDNVLSLVSATITINPAPVMPVFQDIVITGTGGTSVDHTLQVAGIPTNYEFAGAEPASNLGDVTATGAESGGNITITFDLPDVGESTTITGDLFVLYLDATGEQQQFAVPTIIEVDPERSGGSPEDHKKAPTFGISLETNEQLVTEGFSFNGIVLDITDNWHTEFERTSSVIGDTNIVTIKGHAPDGFKQVILSLGVPEVGMVNNADTAIVLNLERDSETGLAISEILYNQSEEGLVDETRTMASVQKASCSLLDNNQQCYEFTIEFAVMAPLLDDVLAISAVDEKRRLVHTYINDGVEFAGESQLLATTDTIFQRETSQDKGEFIELVQQDRRYNVWEDQDGYLWERNSFGTWMRLTYPGLEITPDDPTLSIKTRLHSDFARLVEMEQDRARLVFDGASIQNEVGDSFAYDLPTRIPRHLDPILLEAMDLEEILALEKMLDRYIYVGSWDE